MAYGITEYPNTFKRQDSFPLDSTSLFNNMESALEYINKSNSTAYGGQIISINNNGSYGIYVVQIINNVKTLVNIVPQILNNLTYNVGTYCLYNNINDNNVEFSFDINYPLKAKYYSIYLNDDEEPISDSFDNTYFEIGNSLITSSIIFEQNNIFSIKLFNMDENENEDTLITLYSKNIWNENEKIKFGILSLIK